MRILLVALLIAMPVFGNDGDRPGSEPSADKPSVEKPVGHPAEPTAEKPAEDGTSSWFRRYARTGAVVVVGGALLFVGTCAYLTSNNATIEQRPVNDPGTLPPPKPVATP